jgi:signal transduction histidine kinase
MECDMGKQTLLTDGNNARPQRRRAVLFGYCIALASALLATLVRMWLDPMLGNNAPFTTYFAAVMFTACYCGLGPSLLTIGAGALLGSYLFAEPRGSLYIYDVEHQISLLLYVCTGGFMAILSDWLSRAITRRNRAEADLRLREEQLQRHQTELTHVARLSTMGEMAASLAHELNQPLHAVKNYARGGVRRLLKKDEKDEELLSVLRQISEEANRAAEIIRRVRGFVRKRDPQISKVSVNALVEEVVLLSKADIQRRRARVIVDLATDLPTVAGDPIQIEQVLLNLVRNGLEAMDDAPDASGRRQLWIDTKRHGDDRVEVSVRDRGKGINGDDMEKVFEPFFTTKAEGLGMGLAICRSIVQTHEGRLWVSANQEQGCTFHFTLPAGRT